MPKKILFSVDVREKMLAGVEALNKAVSATLGPSGRNVVVERLHDPLIVTKDGVTVAKEFEVEDHFENMGATLVKEAATKTNDLAGDGTTTATVLAHAMITEGMKHLQPKTGDLIGKQGHNVIAIKNGMFKAVKAVTDELAKLAKAISKPEELKAVATISAQDEGIGQIIADVIAQVGKDGIVTVEAGQTASIEKEYVEGMQFDNGFASPLLMTDLVARWAVFEEAPILITDQRIDTKDDLKLLMEKLFAAKRRKLVVIAEHFGEEVLRMLVINKIQGQFETLAIKAPGFGLRRKELLKDIAALTGSSFVSEELGHKLADVQIEDLGCARKVVATIDSTIIIDGAGTKAAIKKRLEEIEAEMKAGKTDVEREKAQERIAKLKSGIAVIKVGAITEVEQKEKQYRVEDALSATRAAAEEGIVPGGGTAYLRCLKALENMGETADETLGVDIVRNALSAPCRTIADNAGASGAEVVEKVMKAKGNTGYNALTDKYEDLVKAMVIDPKKVTRCALEHAVSVAAMFLTLEAGMTVVRPKDGDKA